MAELSTCSPLTRQSVIEAGQAIKPLVHRTPVLTCCTLDKLASSKRSADSLRGSKWEGQEPANPRIQLFFKCENFQRGGAFKARGAFHAIEKLKREPGWLENGGLTKGVATHSSGNHAQALALAARQSGIPAHVVMPEISVRSKIEATKGYGARVTLIPGSTAVEREAATARVIDETGARLVPPYDHPDILLGQGTQGLELQEQAREILATRGQDCTSSLDKGLDAIITPCGGGGMLSGVALSCEGTGIRVFGAEPEFEDADDCKRGMEAGKRIEAVKTLTVADGLRTPVGVYPWSVIYGRRLVQNVYSVSEEQIVATARLVLERMKILIEPSAAVPLAVVLFNEDFRAMVEREAGTAGWDIGVVFSGGNISLERLSELYCSKH